jgi:hypothetical protein
MVGYRAFFERWFEGAVIPKYLEIVSRTADSCRHARVSAKLSSMEVP